MKLTVLIAATLLVTPTFAQAPSMDGSLQALLADAKVVKTLDAIKADDARAFEEQSASPKSPRHPSRRRCALNTI
jgi:hypothetical protein